MNEQDKLSLLAFAEFLVQRGGDVTTSADAVVSIEPVSIPRPESESVVAAIKRLSASYHMLEKSELLTETSSLMTAHIMQGREAKDVIDELEVLFSRYHKAFLSKQEET
ncbi:MAG: Crp/Fnr family transcriptional regulator [Sedimenticola sp.]|nr:Crp/Fnr family transcriptional regulator [Sedimenticola sp.]